ncbi:hypothetical protein DOTSEDRAFT_74039 [Dothistroma septosporum NZE10]|uniref:Uncharacterized protein n=1 Tax=Dothistroma septosporum (strain NZE10 / CBS 128990) TaxID=675120 RepID=N1PHJ5_DOTSN|nr:hypothetical protein DOTSEDRAFT_74039 [Dothistroma septosporum NZE10]
MQRTAVLRMQRTLARSMPIDTETGASALQPWRRPVHYKAYKSPYGPRYKVPWNVYGIESKTVIRWSKIAAGYGTMAGTVALFFFDGVPRVKKDILQKLSLIGGYFIDYVPPEDNPF